MAQGLIKTKLGSSKGKAPNKDAKKGKRTIAPRRANLVKNATLIKVSFLSLKLSHNLSSACRGVSQSLRSGCRSAVEVWLGDR